MSDKEQINTLIATGDTLPPVNPYLDDTIASDTTDANNALAKKKPGRAPVKPAVIDPKEYIAELERSEDENLF
ncbi:hypothetical protein COT50_03185 [candidate division WWE3 bacterium CG08_land_8_20_14_0_20_41_10]|uniref:Uncharacterized protein n=1 Tax=candidate division WWE3 bacterium CG08_land_8_20_14_0_20_41_10 TaxID=1975085 RepID=A0A2H0XB98_UNCKA|nr:MAG: hypothetical protein COT50_03185 [candidate division WWE3 bacterium CG08_land_8_20_14_0_20_41_10]